MWNNPTVQMLLPWIIALRSILVYVLIAYEGRRLMQDDKQVVSAQSTRLTVLKNALLDRAIERVTPMNQPAQLEPSEQPKQFEQGKSKQSAKLHVVKAMQDTAPLERVRKALSEHPNAGYNELGRLTDLAPATAKKYRELSTTQDERVATGGS